MKLNLSATLKQHKILVLQCLIVFFAVALATAVVLRVQSRFARARQHFDFSRTDDDAAGPAVGEVLDLSSIRTRTNSTFAQTLKDRPLAMLALIDPHCGACSASKTSLRSLGEQLEKGGIRYYVLMIPEGTEPQKYFTYVDAMNLNAESFIWPTAETNAPASLLTMVVPSHLLVTGEGRIVGKWPGVPRNAESRDNAFSQIATEAAAKLSQR